ncbi:YgaP-like transmembrane domain [Natranaerobius thermophilus]|uniref:Inner membrane protein YgaP-like transmembrane domain-containing protein n=1 Tax=Natranaerobius thermophilus (strain ATCC BAA-1301 / DSM 18059 / JW/NM-WN-LF) TaxID=457570 RepID=B2A3E4_NATTJ|nr:YgaP-like transmembrane domain [Natranaerobius thermophilus]ACB86373.1 hypothetical protein Nther_2825 [Natranaerobius thermophilus JW/NM-WN-LF]
MIDSMYIQKNVGFYDRIIRIVIGIGLIVVPVLFGFPGWLIALLAALGGSNILEGVLGF